jgi:hypothetical protein
MSKNRPKMLPEPLTLYPMKGKYPDILRVSFEDGTTRVYDLRITQPHPIVRKNIELIRRICVGYEWKEKAK